MKKLMEALQPLGRALMLPIAVLPVAALLLRLGQPDLFDIPFMAAAGAAIFDHLGLIFAIGVGVGLARDNHGAAGLAGALGFLVATQGMQALIAPEQAAQAVAKVSVPIGLISGLLAGWFYNRFSAIRLPDYLSFFGGRRFVPILSGLAGLAVALVFGLANAAVSAGMDHLSHAVAESGSFGLFAYGALNRLLIVTGLHHILNNVVWFLLGDFQGATGDLRRFFAGDPSAGAFMSGFFPVMMFGLPGACLAIYRSALPERRKAVGGMLLSMALTSFLTGVTEPIEFSFMFLAPALYALHALLTGLSMALMDWLGVRLGFGFSAGLFDYVLNYGKATRPLLLIPVGLGFFAFYYALFRFAIRRFDLKTPGREPEAAGTVAVAAGERGAAYVAALGGAGNLVSIDACTTRLRLVLADPAKADEAALKALGAKGIVRPGSRALQVVLGPMADLVASEMRAAAGASAQAPAGAAPAEEAPAGTVSAEPLLLALGGRGNLVAHHAASSRLRVELADPAKVDEAALVAAGVRAIARPAPAVLHLILGPEAARLAI
ncbi:N-acetylglucosamine-specific PTS transporter subunit IIBC [Sandaracinobacter sp. RS1-74]|uniref:N-acetylglucosamine-specific PTS transporter subunit IIBC n=1 Tax=Sandaracinobacteroides sayramensis TaxID=2913411 RepID=UPI001ED9EF1C|nr:N-acetylglucosamine-specific PTS transporter subunit IIBC [Sandaracinobacteroides sayramensis]MCG2842106.1 N-acetylglucosamine-specific PTS transporter subunit IIBC [Sandaracinobacteroides sayramensis]